MAKVQLMSGVTVSENLLKANWPTQHTTLDESVVRAAEEAQRRFGIIPFSTADYYFAAVDSFRKGDSPLATVILNSQDDSAEYANGGGVRSSRRYDRSLVARSHRKAIRNIPQKRDKVKGREVKEMKPWEVYDSNARRHYALVRPGIATTELPYANVASLPKFLRDRVLSEYRADQADFILEILKKHKGMGVGQMMNVGVFVPDIEKGTLYFIDANVESALAEKGLKPSDFHKYERLGVLNYTTIGRGLVLVTAGEGRIAQRPLDTKDVYSEVKTPRGMKSVIAGEPTLVHLKPDVESNLFEGRYRDTPPTPNPIDHAPLH